MAFDPVEQRKIMGMFATGVTVVTTSDGQKHNGLTANALTSLSLDPPLVIVAVDRRAASHKSIMENRCFAVNILTQEQQPLSDRFAKSGPKDFSDLKYTSAITGSPILADTLGYVDCQVTHVMPGGDHDIFVGEIVAGGAGIGNPLLYFQGKYRNIVTD
ncbi:MAG: flavin reductase family protein [Planctomycetota bacterium]|nr:flavin reductase family protein [Planctomycetota bacterium]MDA1212597.1 flavin reductase family protein [Planctomycetota bacterium]